MMSGFELEMPKDKYEEYIKICNDIMNKQIIKEAENEFIKKLRDLVFRKDISDNDFRKFVMNFIQAGGLE